MPHLPSKHELNLEDNIRKLQNASTKVIQLQEAAKQHGKFTNLEQALYKENLDVLTNTAQNLAKIQERLYPIELQQREGLSVWFERKAVTSKDKKKKDEQEKRKPEEESKKKKDDKKKKDEDDKKKKEEEDKKKKEEEDKRKEEENKKEVEEEKEEDDDTIAINLPSEDASVAEAKPVGLAVAGDGGVAASKPIATAIVGPGGLAIARPVGTAIAGVSPDQTMIPLFVEGYSSGGKSRRNSTDAFISGLISKVHPN